VKELIFSDVKGKSGTAKTLSRPRNTVWLLSMQECLSVTPMGRPQGLIYTIAGFCYSAVERGEASTSNEVTENATQNTLAMSPVTDGTW